MKPGIVADDILDQLLPYGTVKQTSIRDCVVDKAGALGKNPAAPDGIVPDFTVAHIRIRRHANGGSMRFQPGGDAIGSQPVQGRRTGLANDITRFVFADTDSIQYCEYHWSFWPRVIAGFF